MCCDLSVAAEGVWVVLEADMWQACANARHLWTQPGTDIGIIVSSGGWWQDEDDHGLLFAKLACEPCMFGCSWRFGFRRCAPDAPDWFRHVCEQPSTYVCFIAACFTSASVAHVCGHTRLQRLVWGKDRVSCLHT